jgi:tetratricopeptide (TPR) repeat protein
MRVLAVLTLLGATGSVRAEDDRMSRFTEANRLYFEGRYDEASRKYASLVMEFRVEDAALYHNLGNAHFRSGSYGKAILAYKRALALEPDGTLTDTLERNLDAARRTLQTRYRASSDTALTYATPASALYRITHAVEERPLAVAFMASWTLLFAALIWRRLQASPWPSRLAVALGLCAGAAGLMLAGRMVSDAEGRLGVIVVADAKIRDGRHEVAQGRDLPEGLEVRIVESDNEGWTQVELASGKRGWVASEDIDLL